MEPTAPKSSRLKRVLQNLALSAGTFLLCLVVLEVALRFMGYGNLEIYEPDAKLYWKLKPNQDCYTKIDRKPVHINSKGTRGLEFNRQKSPGTIRILSLGDSRTFGWGLTESETYSKRLQDDLQRELGTNRKVEVINAGVNAWSYPQMLVYLREHGLAFHPDMVVLAEANLWTQFSESNSPEFVKKFMLRVQLKNLLRRFATYHYFVEVKLKAFYERHRSKFIPVDPRQDALFKEQQQKDPDAVFRSAIEGVCALALSNAIKPVLLYLPTATDLNLGDSNAVLRVKREVSRKLQVALVDVTSELAPAAKELYLEADPVHLNARGNDIVARQLLQAVRKTLSNEQVGDH